MKTPPDRSGITFEVGAQLEARDRHKNWYAATIEKIDYDKERIQVHYRQWSRRHNEWFHWTSPYLRPLERVSLRRRGLNPASSLPMFVSGSKVMACWTDCRFYPAKILRVNKDDSYTVRFYDGVVLTVKPTKVKPFQEKSRSEKSAVGSEGWEEGESEEEEEAGGQRVEEEEEEEEERNEEASGEREGAGEGEEERKRKAEPSSSHPPAKKKTDSRIGAAQNQPITADCTQPEPASPAHVDRGNLQLHHNYSDVLLERQAHLPTTHKFSREPLYRVIKNQPPPILSIELDHNPFKCPADGCSKSFRKASLLHYHIKYYHSDQPPDEQPETPRRKRSSSKGSDFLSDGKGEEQEACRHDDRQRGIAEAEVKKEGERSGDQDRKERKNFLRVKLKKKKKKKKKKKSQAGLGSSDEENSDRPAITLTLSAGPEHELPRADDGSDWSTLTAESGEDTPTWHDAMETEECELVRCVCEVDEENDFMIQCESCLCWQHGTCMGLYEHNVPHNYTCYYCRHTAGWRRAQRFLSEPDLLISGHMFGLSCVKENYSETNAATISHTNSLLAHTHALNQVLSGLQLKISLLDTPSHPDLQLWRLPWRREEGLRAAGGPRGEPPVCYVSSEHCYQKPGASWEKAQAAVKQQQEEEIDLRGIKPEAVDQNPNDVPTDANVAAHTDRRQHARAQTCPAPEAECQLNLLEHVESLHHQISGRMDVIERELDVLESWLDHSGELEPPDPLSRLPQLKQRIRRLLRDLCTVRHLSVWR
uniref:C2H2-type domain-containing protein n=2 Tax=Gasterosteus aculeatus aculeatus TaxID=481459 RepID=G3N5R9_GASAC